MNKTFNSIKDVGLDTYSKYERGEMNEKKDEMALFSDCNCFNGFNREEHVLLAQKFL